MGQVVQRLEKGVNFRCGEAIGLDQSFEAQPWRSRRTERPLTGARDHSLHPNITSGYQIIFFSQNRIRLLEALIFDLGRSEGLLLKTLKTLYIYLHAVSGKLRVGQPGDMKSLARYYRCRRTTRAFFPPLAI